MQFAEMISIAENKTLKMSDVLGHPLGPLPRTLALADGSLRGINISSLAKEHQKNMKAADIISQPRARIIDSDEELGEEQFERSATKIPATKQEIEAAKRELRFVRRSTENKLRQTMEKLKRFLEFRGSCTVMRLLLEHGF